MSWVAEDRIADWAQVDVVPVDDLIGHERSESCVCGPQLECISNPRIGDVWIISHASLDGREATE